MGALFFGSAMLLIMGGVYPVGGVIYYKLLKKDSRGIKEILDAL